MDPAPLYAPAKSITTFFIIVVALIVLAILYKIWKK